MADEIPEDFQAAPGKDPSADGVERDQTPEVDE